MPAPWSAASTITRGICRSQTGLGKMTIWESPVAQQEPEVGHFFFVEQQPERAARAKTAVSARVRAFFMGVTTTATFLLSSVLLGFGLSFGCAHREPAPDPVSASSGLAPQSPRSRSHWGLQERAAIQRFKTFLGTFTEEKLPRGHTEAYTPRDGVSQRHPENPAWLRCHREYFLGSLANTESITVVFTDMARSGKRVAISAG